MRGRRHFAGRLLGVVCAIFLALLAGELGSRAYFWFDVRWSGRPRSVVLEGRLQEHDSLLGYRLIPNARGRLRGPEFDTEVVINAAGLRQAKTVPYERRAGVKRILVAGDSFTFGHGVNVEDRFTERLEAMVPGIETVNMGVWGTGTDQQLLLFQQEGLKYRPDLTVLCYMVENIVRNGTAERPQPDGTVIWKPKFVLDHGTLTLSGVPVPPPGAPQQETMNHFDERWSSGLPIPYKRYLKTHSALYQLVHRGLGGALHAALRPAAVPFPEYAENREEWLVTRAIIRKFADAARSSGNDFLLVVVPTVDYVYKSYVPDIPSRFLRRMCDDEGIHMLDLLPGLREAAQRGRPLYYSDDDHWTPEGHRIAAHLIAEYLARQGISPSDDRLSRPTRQDILPDSHERAPDARHAATTGSTPSH